LTAGLDPSMRRKIAFLSVGVAFVMLMFFAVAGQLLLIAMSLKLILWDALPVLLSP